MAERGPRAEAACFEGVWADLGGLRLLLLRARGRTNLDPEDLGETLRSGALGSSVDPDTVLSSLRRLPGLAKLREECDFGYVELLANGTQLSLAFTGRRTKCIPLAPIPDRVNLVELFLRGADGSAPELDALQRSSLARRSLRPGEDLHAACLVGEVLDPSIVAIGVELLNSGYRTILAEELKQTYVEERPRPARSRKPGRRSKRRRKKRKGKRSRRSS